MSDKESITLTRTVEKPSVSLAQMLKSQYTSKEFNDIFASTELREYEVIGFAGVCSTRFVSMVMATEEWQLEGLDDGEEKKKIEERLLIKKMILNDPNAMAFVIQDCFLYAFGLGRQSLKRQSRTEAMKIAMSPRPTSEAEDVGIKDKLFTKLGVSRKYRTGYMERE